MRTYRSCWALGAALALATGLVQFPSAFAQEKDTEKTPPAKEAAPAGEKEKVPPAKTEGPADCEQLPREIRTFYDSLPTDLRSLKKEEADLLARKVAEQADRADKVEKECTSLDKVKMAEVKYMHGKFLYLLSERLRYELINKSTGLPNATEENARNMKAYFSRVQALSREAYGALSGDHPFRPRALELQAQSQSDGEDVEEARRSYEKFLAEFPKDSSVDRIILDLGRTYYDLENYDMGLDLIEKAIKDHYKTESYPNYVEILWKIHNARGDLEGMMRSVETVEKVFPLRLSSDGLSSNLKDRLQLAVQFGGFRKGYVHFAMGDFTAARAAFSRHIEDLTGVPKLNPASEVYRTRSTDNLKFLDNLAGLPAPKELDLDWVTPRKVKLSESKGKVVALVFRGVGDSRSQAFLGPLSRYCAAHPDMEVVVICYTKSGHNPGERAEKFREELARAGYDGPAGFDPDTQDHTIFRAYQAYVGSATFEVINRRGELVWFQQDPRGIDKAFAESVLKRVAAD